MPGVTLVSVQLYTLPASVGGKLAYTTNGPLAIRRRTRYPVAVVPALSVQLRPMELVVTLLTAPFVGVAGATGMATNTGLEFEESPEALNARMR